MTLRTAVKNVESSNRSGAMKFEPGVMMKAQNPGSNEAWPKLLESIGKLNACDRITSCVIASTSWGLYQFLGETLYGGPVNLGMPLFVFLSSVAEQDHAFNVWCSAQGFNPDEAVTRTLAVAFAAKWNGPGNIDVYSKALLANA